MQGLVEFQHELPMSSTCSASQAWMRHEHTSVPTVVRPSARLCISLASHTFLFDHVFSPLEVCSVFENSRLLILYVHAILIPSICSPTSLPVFQHAQDVILYPSVRPQSQQAVASSTPHLKLGPSKCELVLYPRQHPRLYRS